MRIWISFRNYLKRKKEYPQNKCGFKFLQLEQLSLGWINNIFKIKLNCVCQNRFSLNEF